MKNQWTTVSENNAATTAKKPSGNTQEKRNKKVALAMASIGVFFILVGAAPFLFGDSDSTNYSAFIAQSNINSIDAELAFDPQPMTISFEDGDEFVAEAVVAEEVAIQMPAVPATPGFSGGSDIAVTEIPVEPIVEAIVEPVAETIPVAAEQMEAINPVAQPLPVNVDITQEDFSEPTIIPGAAYTPAVIEGTFPANQHVGSTAAPVAIAETMGDYHPLDDVSNEEATHAAATPMPKETQTNPATGLPVLPLLAFSGAAALYSRFRKNRK